MTSTPTPADERPASVPSPTGCEQLAALFDADAAQAPPAAHVSTCAVCQRMAALLQQGRAVLNPAALVWQPTALEQVALAVLPEAARDLRGRSSRGLAVAIGLGILLAIVAFVWIAVLASRMVAP